MRPLIFANSPRLAFNVTTCLGTCGTKSHVMTGYRWSPFHASEHWLRHTPVSIESMNNASSELANRIWEYCKSNEINAIIPADETATRFLIKHSGRFDSITSFPCPTLDLFESLCNKWEFAQLADRCGSAHPRTVLIETANDLSTLDLGYPLIVKPVQGTSAEGVFVVQETQTLRRYVDRLEASGELPILAQQFLEGYDMDLTILADHGHVIAWTIQRRRFEQAGVEFLINDDMLELGTRIVEATGFHGIVDFDLRFETKRDRAQLMEANPRFPGTLRFKLAAGVNFPMLGMSLARGDIPSSRVFEPVAGVCFDHGLAPRKRFQAMLRGSTCVAFTGFTDTAYRINLSDPFPHALTWLGSWFGAARMSAGHQAGDLPLTHE